MTTTLSGPETLADPGNFTAGFRHDRSQQPPLFSRSVCDPGPWRQGHRVAAWQEIARALPANLGLEYTVDGWRIITAFRDVERVEGLAHRQGDGDVIPDDVMLERRRRVCEAELLVAQAKAVLRAVNLELQAKAA